VPGGFSAIFLGLPKIFFWLRCGISSAPESAGHVAEQQQE